MYFTKVEYDPVRDLQPVDQFGVVDAKKAFFEGVVPSQLPNTDTDYNGIDNPDSILGKPRDIFDALQMEHSINNYVPDKENNE